MKPDIFEEIWDDADDFLSALNVFITNIDVREDSQLKIYCSEFAYGVRLFRDYIEDYI